MSCTKCVEHQEREVWAGGNQAWRGWTGPQKRRCDGHNNISYGNGQKDLICQTDIMPSYAPGTRGSWDAASDVFIHSSVWVTVLQLPEAVALSCGAEGILL